MKIWYVIAAVTAAAAVAAFLAFAYPSDRETPLPTPSVLLANAEGQSGDFSGIGRFQGSSTCTGFFLKTDSPGAPAYVLTNGHCATSWNPNTVTLGAPADGMKMVFGYFYDTVDRQEEYPAKQIAYSTMKGTDIAIIELDATYGELVAKGYAPLEISESRPVAGDRIAVVGAPSDGFEDAEKFLRRADCTLGIQANLVEFVWHFFDAYRNDCADIKGGSSGSPVISNGRVMGLMFTTTAESPGADCYLGRPCEAGEEPRVVKDTSYATGVSGVDRCFAEGRFDVTAEECTLDGGRQLALDGYPPRAVNPSIAAPIGRTWDSWQTSLAGDQQYYRYKAGPEGQIDCRDPAGYGPVFSIVEKNEINDPLPTREGRYYLCVLAGDSSKVDASWQEPKFATLVHVAIDMTPPKEKPSIHISDFGDQYRLTYDYSPPELSLYQLKIGAPDDTDCEEKDGYFIPRLDFITLEKAEAPYKVCAIGFDDADNPSPPEAIMVQDAG